jgi:hypothetical protein
MRLREARRFFDDVMFAIVWEPSMPTTSQAIGARRPADE